MGLFSDFNDLVKEVKSFGDDIKQEFSGLKEDVVSSVGDIKDGARETAHGVKEKVKGTVNIDGIKNSATDLIKGSPASEKSQDKIEKR